MVTAYVLFAVGYGEAIHVKGFPSQVCHDTCTWSVVVLSLPHMGNYLFPIRKSHSCYIGHFLDYLCSFSGRLFVEAIPEKHCPICNFKCQLCLVGCLLLHSVEYTVNHGNEHCYSYAIGKYHWDSYDFNKLKCITIGLGHDENNHHLQNLCSKSRQKCKSKPVVRTVKPLFQKSSHYSF